MHVNAPYTALQSCRESGKKACMQSRPWLILGHSVKAPSTHLRAAYVVAGRLPSCIGACGVAAGNLAQSLRAYPNF